MGAWLSNSLLEENHAAILAVCRGFLNIGKLPEQIVPDSISDVDKTLSLAREIKSKITSTSLSLKVVLQMALDLENSIAENQLQTVLNEVTDSELIKKLRTLQLDSEHHASKIRQIIETKFSG